MFYKFNTAFVLVPLALYWYALHHSFRLSLLLPLRFRAWVYELFDLFYKIKFKKYTSLRRYCYFYSIYLKCFV